MTFTSLLCVVVIQLCLLQTALGNTALPPTWSPREYGECIPTNTCEGVGYPGNGKTCNFAQTSMQPYLWNIYKDGFVAAASQDLYNGFHTQDDFSLDCDTAAQTENVTDDNCGQNCGVCFMVSGPIGSTVFLVQEIADINAVQNNGQGLNLHLSNAGGQINYVRSGSGVALDLTWKRIPCPVCGGIYIWYIQYNHAQTWQNAIFFTVINHRIGVEGVWVRHGMGSSDRNWYRLPKQWTNQFRYEAYGDPKKIAWMPEGAIHGGSTNSDFDLKIVSHLDEEIICIGLTVTLGVSKETQACLDADGNALQFSLPTNVSEAPCNTTIAYHDNTWDQISTIRDPPKIKTFKWAVIDVDYNGKIETFKDVILTPNIAKEWNWKLDGTRHKPGITVKAIEINRLLEESDYIILSKGIKEMLHTKPDTIIYLEKAKKNGEIKDYFILQSHKAATQYTNMVDNGQKVSGLFHSTC